MSDESIIYLVTNGTWAESWWPVVADAQARAEELNASSTYQLTWTTVAVKKGSR